MSKFMLTPFGHCIRKSCINEVKARIIDNEECTGQVVLIANNNKEYLYPIRGFTDVLEEKKAVIKELEAD